MHSKNEQSVNIDLSSILEGLARAKIKFILVGGLAAVIQGAPVTTLDVDIVYERSTENIKKILDFLESVDAVYRRPDDKVIRPRKNDFLVPGHRLFKSRLGPIDILAFIEKEQTYEDLIENTAEIEFRGHKIHILNLKTLIKLKKSSNDPKDKQKLPVLEETLRQIEKR